MPFHVRTLYDQLTTLCGLCAQLCLPLLLRHDATLLRPLLPPEALSQVVAACAKYSRRGSFAADPPSSTMASYRASMDSQRQSEQRGSTGSQGGQVPGLKYPPPPPLF